MSKSCYFSGKKNVAGRTKKHNYGGGWEFKATNKPRTFKVNMRKIKIVEEGTPKTVWVSMRYYKKLQQEMK